MNDEAPGRCGPQEQQSGICLGHTDNPGSPEHLVRELKRATMSVDARLPRLHLELLGSGPGTREITWGLIVRRLILFPAAAVAISAAVLVSTTVLPTSDKAGAATTSVDLAFSSASFAGNAKTINNFVVATFTATNKGPGSAPNTDIYIKSITHLAYSGGNGYCVETNGTTINNDNTSCEFTPSFAVGAHESNVIVVTPGPLGTTGTITMCLRFESAGYTDPVSSNNCKTLTIRN